MANGQLLFQALLLSLAACLFILYLQLQFGHTIIHRLTAVATVIFIE